MIALKGWIVIVGILLNVIGSILTYCATHSNRVNPDRDLFHFLFGYMLILLGIALIVLGIIL